MKDKTIALMKQAGLSEQQAEKAWQGLLDQACGGAEPTEAGAALLSDEDVLASQGTNKLAARAILAALRAVQGTP